MNSSNIPEAFSYGSNFSTLEELSVVVDQRRQANQPLYGHALIYPQQEGEITNRIAARVGHDGTIMIGAHCEWI